MERQKIDHEYLLEHGFIFDEEETKTGAVYEEQAYGMGSEYKVYRDRGRQIYIQREFNNRYGEEGYGVHIDNRDFESIGWGCFLYVDEFETFLKLFKDDIYWV